MKIQIKDKWGNKTFPPYRVKREEVELLNFSTWIKKLHGLTFQLSVTDTRFNLGDLKVKNDAVIIPISKFFEN